MAKRRRKSLGKRAPRGNVRPHAARHAAPFGGESRRPGLILGALIEGNKQVLAVLDEHGVTFCAGCFITLFSSPEKAAAYHAVPDVKAFLSDLARAAKRAS